MQILQDLEEAIISSFAEVDRPVDPGLKGLDFFNEHITSEMKQERRKRLFSVTREDVIRVAETYLSSESSSFSTVIGPSTMSEPPRRSWNKK